MAKGVYIGVGGVARKIKKGYVGIGGVARKIKKAYIGVGGVARPCWSGGEISYYGAITGLSQKRTFLNAAPAGEKYGIFHGGTEYSSSVKTSRVVDAYNTAFVRTTLSGYLERYKYAAAGTKSKAVFIGGRDIGWGADSEAYSDTLVRTTFSGLANIVNTTEGYYGTALPLGDGIAVGTGSDSVDYGISNWLNVVSDTLVVTSAGTVGASRYVGSGTYNKTHAIFSSYDPFSRASFIAGLDINLVVSTPAASPSKYNGIATRASSGEYGIASFVSSTSSGPLCAYNKNLVRTDMGMAEGMGAYCAAVTLNNRAIIAGGYISGNVLAAVFQIDENLVRTQLGSLSVARQDLAGVSFGDSALFGGGHTNSTIEGTYSTVSTVDAFVLA